MSYINKIAILLSFVILVACVNDNDFEIPSPSSNETIIIPANKLTTFRAIHNRYKQAVNRGNAVAQINTDEDLYIEGYVISSDAAGNFFKELIIQNKTDASSPDADPRLGLRIDVNVSSLSDTYDFGRRVYIKLAGLTIGESNGVITIGTGDAAIVKQIQAVDYRRIIIKTPDVVTITPKRCNIEDLTQNDQNTLIQLNTMQLNRFQLGSTFASEAIDEFDGFRTFENCKSGVSIIMQTSTFSDFKSLIIPQGQGHITGVYSRDFRDNFNVLILNSATAINFENNTRCDPIELSCGLASTIQTANLFYEDFESQRNNRVVEGNGWTNYIETGTVGWEGYSSVSSNASLGRSARFQPASSGDASNIGWLITPTINLDTQDGETLSFKTSNSLADSSFMEVLISLNWDGNKANVTSATWHILSDAYVVKDTDSFVPWFNSGHVDLSCLRGNAHIAFKYTGSGQVTFDGVYELDEVSIDYVE